MKRSLQQRLSLLLWYGLSFGLSLAQVVTPSSAGLTAQTQQVEKLLLAAGQGKIETIKVLLATGLDINVRSEAGVTPLMRAAAGGQVETVQFLLTAGADAKAKLKDGRDALWLTIEYSHKDLPGWQQRRLVIVKALIAAGADVNQTFVPTPPIPEGEQKKGNETPAIMEMVPRTPLCFAAMLGSREYAEALLAAGARADVSPAPSLFLFSSNERDDSLAVLKRLLAEGVDINARMPLSGATVLLNAVRSEREDLAMVVKELLALGATVAHKDKMGKTALDYARALQRDDLVQLLAPQR